MATIRKRGNRWQVQIKKKINGTLIRESKSFSNKSQAQAWETMREADLIQSDRQGEIVGNKYTLYDALIKYKDEVLPTRKSKDAIEREINTINKFIRESSFIGELLKDIKPYHFAAWRDLRLKSVKGSTVNRELNIFSSMYTSAIKDWGWCSMNPILTVKRPKNPKHRERLVTPEEIELLLKELNYIEGEPPKNNKQEIAYLFLLSIETAARVGELLALTPDRVFIDKRFIRFLNTKNSDHRDVPLTNRAAQLLSEVLKNGHSPIFKINPKSRDTQWRAARDKVGIKGLTYHDSRHSATTKLASKLHVLDLAKTTGHKNLKQLLTYYNETAEDIASKLD